MNKTKVMFLLPLYGGVPSNSVLCLINLMIDSQEYYDVHYIALLDLYVPWCRCKLIGQVLEFIKTGNDLDVIFFMDQDHYYKSNDFMNLISAFEDSDFDVMGAFYRYKDQTQRPVAYNFVKNDKGVKCMVNLEDLKPNSGIVDVDAIGLGFCVMKPDFIKRMFKKHGSWMFMTEVKDNVFQGEDIAFFRRAKEIRAKVGLNTDIYIKHVGAAI